MKCNNTSYIMKCNKYLWFGHPVLLFFAYLEFLVREHVERALHGQVGPVEVEEAHGAGDQLGGRHESRHDGVHVLHVDLQLPGLLAAPAVLAEDVHQVGRHVGQDWTETRVLQSGRKS